MTQSTIKRATGAIQVTSYDDVAYGVAGAGPELHRLIITESFTGDIVGTGQVEFLQVRRGDGSASFVGVERVSGTIDGRTGTFVLQDQGTMVDGRVSGTWFVVPGSGTGDLAGLRGEGGFTANYGQDAEISLDYWFE